MKPPQHHKHVYHQRRVTDETDAQDADNEQIMLVEVDNATGVHRFWVRINVARPICNALLGEEHSPRQRMLTGVGVMALGVLIAKCFGHSPMMLISSIGDCVGYGLHGLGLTPFIEHLAERVRRKRT
jgi:hypothetical protein